MRIITGSAKGKRLLTLEGDATRPTSQRMKEAMFSAIQFDIEGRTVLDLFAGCGQLGLEALSRGADSVMFVDAAQEAVDCIKRNAKATGFFERCRYLTSDYRNYIRKAAARDSFDLVFIDPPYATHAVGDALARLVDKNMLRRGALLVCESGDEDIFGGNTALADCFDDVRHRRYGPSHIHIMTYLPKEQDGHE